MRAFLLTLSAAAALQACATIPADKPGPRTPTSRYSLRTEPGLERIALAVHDNGLSANQHSALRDLAARYAAAGASALRVEAPAGNDPAADRQAYAVRDALLAAGVPSERIQVVGYAAPDARAPVLAGFEILRAVVPDCALEPRTTGSRFSNQSSLGFGCAVTANMAAQIADPPDIIAPRTFAPADSGRSAVVFDAYRKGDPSSTEQEPLVAGRVAQAVE